jgi:hypothetical protein
VRVWLLPCLGVCLAACTSTSKDDTGSGPVELTCEGAPPPTWYADLDGDGFGRAGSDRAACEAPEDYVANADDCDDARAGMFPGAAEACDGLDGDCDGQGDETDPDVTRASWYLDADADGFGDADATTSACAAPPGYVAAAGDCADDNAAVFPDAPDVCGGGDDDCDGADDACTREGELSVADADATLVGEAAGDGAGTWIAVGDVDGDGIADVLTSAPYAEGVAGAAWLVRGPFTGTRRLEDADLRIAGTPAVDDVGGFAIGPVALGDLDGDGLAELVIAAPNGGAETGVWRFMGTARGAMGLDTADGERLGGPDEGAGTSLAIGGDLDGDGLLDLLVGAPGASVDGVERGGVALVSGAFGGTGLLADTATWLFGETAGAEAGAAVASPGDIDGDGFADLLVGAPGAVATSDLDAAAVGAAWLFYGPLSGSPSLADADGTLYGEAAGDRAGAALAGVGDIDGDGVGDLMIGAPGVDLGGDDTGDLGSDDVGAAYLVRGPVAGEGLLADAHCTLLGDTAGHDAGTTIVALGDMNEDGRADVAVGGAGAGRAWLLLGPFAGTVALTYAEVTLVGGDALDETGAGLAGGADLDGDGGLDLLVGSPGADAGGSGAGMVSMVRGWVR